MHQSFNQRVHFYYCVLVALKMHGKSKKAGGIRGKNNFLLKWLRRAQDNNIFPPDITSEIEWLRGKIIQAGYDTDLEPMLDFVYATASRAEALKNARHGRRDVPCHVSIPGSANSAGAIQPRSIL